MNKLELEIAMKKKGVTTKQLCKAIGMSRSAFYRKCNGISEFTIGDINKIVAYLELKTPMGIFFDEEVS